MLRLVIVVIALSFALPCADADAKGPFGRWRSNSSAFGFRIGSSPFVADSFGASRSGYSSYGYAGNGGFGYPGTFPAYGFGYVYDPYATGKFKAPDLLNDPYFREQNRYDSHFPGRRNSGRPPLQMHQSIPAAQYHHQHFAPDYPSH